jgi:hypothetical protein
MVVYCGEGVKVMTVPTLLVPDGRTVELKVVVERPGEVVVTYESAVLMKMVGATPRPVDVDVIAGPPAGPAS